MKRIKLGQELEATWGHLDLGTLGENIKMRSHGYYDHVYFLGLFSPQLEKANNNSGRGFPGLAMAGLLRNE